MPEQRWVAPPGWPPAPEGWSPPHGWAPDPDWPTPPPGWQWWQPVESAPPAEPGPPGPFLYVAPKIAGKTKKLTRIEAQLRAGERLVAAARLNKISPTIDFVAITDQRVIAGASTLLGTTPLVLDVALDQLDELTSSGGLMAKLTARSEGFRVTELGHLVDDDFEQLTTALVEARGASTPVAPDPEPEPDPPQPPRRPRIDLTKPGQAPAAPTPPAPPAPAVPAVPVGLPPAVPTDERSTILASKQATTALEARIKTLTSGINRRREPITSHAKPRKIRAVGSVKRVVLYDLEVKLDGMVVPLHPQMQATSSTTGTKETRFLRADEDNRELRLYVEWPGGTRSVYWERNSGSAFGSTVTPKDLHAMCDAINTAARQYDAVVAERRRTAAGLTAQLTDELEMAVREGTLAAERHHAHQTELSGHLGVAPGSDRRSRAAQRTLDQAHAAETKVRSTVAQWQRDLDGLKAAATTQPTAAALPQPPPPPPPATPAAPAAPVTSEAGPVDRAELVKLLEDLGGLLAAGILTEEEFARKKAEILARL